MKRSWWGLNNLVSVSTNMAGNCHGVTGGVTLTYIETRWNKCWNTVLNCGHWLGSLVVCYSTAMTSTCLFESQAIKHAIWTLFSHVQMWMYQCFAEVQTTVPSFLTWWVGRGVLLLLKWSSTGLTRAFPDCSTHQVDIAQNDHYHFILSNCIPGWIMSIVGFSTVRFKGSYLPEWIRRRVWIILLNICEIMIFW